MPNYALIKKNSEWISLRRRPLTIAWIAMWATLMFSVAAAMLEMPKAWQVHVMPKLDAMALTQQQNNLEIKNKINALEVSNLNVVLRHELMQSAFKEKEGLKEPLKRR